MKIMKKLCKEKSQKGGGKHSRKLDNSKKKVLLAKEFFYL